MLIVRQKHLAREATSEETEESLHPVRGLAAVYDVRCDHRRRFGLAEPSWVVYAWGEAVVVGEGNDMSLGESRYDWELRMIWYVTT